MSGPIPKRDDERRRRNEPAGGPAEKLDVSTLPVGEPGSIPWRISRPIEDSLLEPDPNWHEVARTWFESLSHSGQAIFYEPSDWAFARLMAVSMSRDLEPQVVGITEDGGVVRDIIPLKGASLAAYLKGMAQLMATEGERRRARVELEGRYKVKKKATVTNIAGRRAEHLA